MPGAWGSQPCRRGLSCAGALRAWGAILLAAVFHLCGVAALPQQRRGSSAAAAGAEGSVEMRSLIEAARLEVELSQALLHSFGRGGLFTALQSDRRDSCRRFRMVGENKVETSGQLTPGRQSLPGLRCLSGGASGRGRPQERREQEVGMLLPDVAGEQPWRGTVRIAVQEALQLFFRVIGLLGIGGKGNLTITRVAVAVLLEGLDAFFEKGSRRRMEKERRDVHPPSVWEDTNTQRGRRRRRRRRRRAEDDDDDDDEEETGRKGGMLTYGRVLLVLFLLVVVECFDDVVEDADEMELDEGEATALAEAVDIKLKYTGEDLVDVKAWAIMCLLSRQLYYGTLLWSTLSAVAHASERSWEQLLRLTGLVLKFVFVFAGGVVID